MAHADDDVDDAEGDDGDDEGDDDEDSLFTFDSDLEMRDVDSKTFDARLTSLPVIRGPDSSEPLSVRQSKFAVAGIDQSKAHNRQSKLRKPPTRRSLLSPGPLVNSLGEIL